MKVISVIPIARGISKETLSYFTASDISPGSIVSVPVRGRTIQALVVQSSSAVESKSEIKSSTFAMKKADELSGKKLFSKEFIDSSEKCAAYFGTTTGSALSVLIPKAILENSEELTPAEDINAPDAPNERFVIQADDEERFSNYKSLIREEFARKFSVFLCLPTIEDIKKAEAMLEKGIEQYTYVLHGSLKKKEIIEVWNKISEEKHPVLIIATGSYFSVPRTDIGSIIIERENSRGYKTVGRPALDIRMFAEIFAKKIGAAIVFGDMLLRIETVWRHKNDEFVELSPLKFRSLSTAEDVLVDMKKEVSGENTFEIISKELALLVQENKDKNQNLFIFGARRGLAPITVCSDCSTIVTCKRCKAPIVLHSSSRERFFLCHRCGERRSAEEKCVTCTSWRLKTLGIGVELIANTLEKAFPNVKIFRIDADSTKTHKKALDTALKFYATPGSVLIGTEMALLYLDKKLDNAAIASIDSLFAIPDFRINEKVFYILLRIRALASQKLLLQTRHTNNKTLQCALKGNLADFYRDEINERELFDYPPFSILIKISLTGERKKVESDMEFMLGAFDSYDVSVFPAFIPNKKGQSTLHALIKLGKKKWIDNDLLSKLLSLPPQFVVSVDPESML